ncbi:MAG: glycosyltransferase family 4 protein, partial [Rhodospirillales bacterium]|nr:glycosyltransferase family 4 protein [Rhodospirillales bacterium]
GPARPAAGDILFAPGAVFVHPEYGAFIEKLARRDGLRVALLIYDIIPLRRPEWCGQAHVHSFRAWFDDVVPRCEILLAISRSAASEAEAYARLNGLALRDQVHAIPIGTGFTTGENHAAPAQTDGLPAPGSYVLCVATIEARKNHLLLFRVWRRLIEAMGADAVPKLALAGRVGWMVGDLMEQMRNTNFLDGHIILVDHPDDGQLEALYRGCLFTVFPSLYEGWGLPVTESLAFGKPCVISNSTSLPEAGGALARYFDPENIAEATEVIRATLADRAGLDAWQAQVAREFRPVPWDESARAVFDRLA